MAQPDISQILAALAQSQPNGTPQAGAPQHQPPSHQPPPGYPPGMMPGQPSSAPPASYLPQPSSTGSVDLSAIKPVNSGSVSIADAIAKARHIAENRGLSSYDARQAAQREDPRLAGRGGRRSRSRSRSPPRRDNYNSNPYRDERREDPRRGNFRRSPSNDRNVRGSRDPPQGFRSNDGETETIQVKSALVGLIIGRNGENLRKVESESGARVQFLQAQGSHVVERDCTISGPLRARESAKAAIFSIIEENGGTPSQPEKGAYTAGMPGRAKVNLPALREGEASTQIMVPDKTVGLIIGRGGETIKDLQERSGCHVNIVGENKSVNGLRPVNLIGSERATATAKEMILEIVESDSRDNQARGGGGSSMPPAGRDRGYDNNNSQRGGGGGGRDHIEKTISVPSQAVGMIIGKGGETIKDMQRTTGCKINVNQPKPPDIYREIDLAGSASAMAEAEKVIWEKVETVRERDAASGRDPGPGRDQGPSQYNAYSQQQAPPAMPGYGQYGAQPQAQAFQLPQALQQLTQQPGATSSDQQDPYAAQQWYAQWFASQMAQQQQQQQQPPGGQ
ncbi:unnamed protein product [Zymoseptoria tritici ST99CH_1A5]|uniref:K Homology domain-containing protein n=2 Tax=Zymoseptoria tritici TaxID=1047171 RepID=A0A1X7REE5_ZYMT9|nr:unnamed protein product [Zymoseptoria tritici ST99CH_3D7]SMY19300.1 unnamed protein product [Zymoseptoria tritici ST99CH_1A5]